MLKKTFGIQDYCLVLLCIVPLVAAGVAGPPRHGRHHDVRPGLARGAPARQCASREEWQEGRKEGRKEEGRKEVRQAGRQVGRQAGRHLKSMRKPWKMFLKLLCLSMAVLAS